MLMQPPGFCFYRFAASGPQSIERWLHQARGVHSGYVSDKGLE
jgi:hypothetical protein